jgi:6-phosphogluconolactonase (cycloisomerase 2 family)
MGFCSSQRVEKLCISSAPRRPLPFNLKSEIYNLKFDNNSPFRPSIYFCGYCGIEVHMKKILFVVFLFAFCMWMSGCGTGSNSSNTGVVGTGGNGGAGSATAALAYIIGNANTMSGVRVDNAGVATVTPGSPVMIPSQSRGIAVRNNLVFVSGLETSGAPTTITGYRADASGALTQLSSTFINGSTLLAFDTTGGFLYASSSFVPVLGQNFTAAGIYGFTVDQTSGVLTQISGSPWTLAEGESVANIAVSPAGTAVCVDVAIGFGTENVDCYPRASDGTIDPSILFTALQGAVGTNDIAISGDSRWIYSTGGAQNVIYYGSTSDPSVSKNAFITSVGFFPISVAADPSGKWVVVADQNSNDVVVYSISSTGAPTGGFTTPLTGVPSFLRFSLNGNFLFVSTTTGTEVFQFDATTGSLKIAPGSPVQTLQTGRLAAQ